MTVVAIAAKELELYFTSFLFYALAAVFLVLAGYFFSTSLFFFVEMGGMVPHLGLWQWHFLRVQELLLVLVPLLTMRLFAEERKLGTLELLFTFPVRDREVLAGKFAAALLVYLAMLAVTAIGPLLLYVFHPFALAPLVAGYVGMILLGVAFLACGIAASAVTESQLVAALLSYAVIVFAWFATWNEAAIGERVAPLLLQLSLFDHFYGFAQGVVDSRDVVYLLAFATFFLFLALRALGARAWRGVA
jgi:ABC-2 type transport system permease protein